MLKNEPLRISSRNFFETSLKDDKIFVFVPRDLDAIRPQGMDDNEKMDDLALNSDFDSSLLHCWDTGTKNENEGVRYDEKSRSNSPQSSPERPPGDSWDGTCSAGFSRLPSFTIEDETGSQKSGSSDRGIKKPTENSIACDTRNQKPSWELHNQARHHHDNSSISEMANSLHKSIANSEKESTVMPLLMPTTASSTKERKVASVSSASSVSSKSLDNANNAEQARGNLTGRSPVPVPAPTTRNAPMLAGAPATSRATDVSPSVMQTEPLTTTQLHPLAIPSSANCPPHVAGTVSVPAPGLMQPTTMFPMAVNTIGNSNFTNSTGLASMQSSQAQNQPRNQISHPMFIQTPPVAAVGMPATNLPQPSNSVHQQQHQGGDTNSSSTPFYLFNAPLELRANFLQSQRMHGIPVAEDFNSYHYGVPVNGFHPENLNTQMNQNTGQNNSSGQLLDTRHGNRKSVGKKNEREQKRAQKITELIDQLREKMESGGWKVEMKSKFQTLSSCAKYVKHLIKITEEKEKAVQKAKSDLEMKERKVEEEKSLQESRSDPESVMSSLTSSTGGSNNAAKTSKGHETDSFESSRKRKVGHPNADGEECKKARMESANDSFGSSESSGSGEERTSNGGRTGQNVSIDKSVSDITESNKDSATNQRSSDDDEESGFSSSRGSDAAVAMGKKERDRQTQHADVVIQGRNADRKHNRSTATSLDKAFELNYEEVFIKSNIPQVIATTAGRIVRWNEFFLKATGVSKAEVKKLTIFSLVKADKLSNLFEIVAAALRKGSLGKDAELESRGESGNERKSEKVAQPQWDYAAMTLPCVDFRTTKRRGDAKAKNLNPLYITVTLMRDDDPRKRLFHCMFTDCPGTNGALGSITPELLALHFTRGRKGEPAETRKCEKVTKLE